MEKLCDLHAHSTASDGTLTPAELLRLAVETGLSAVVLCDHNTVAGLPEFTEAAKRLPLEAVPAIEFTTEFENTELHMLALWVQPVHYAAINKILDDFKARKAASNVLLVENLAKAGYRIDYETIQKEHSYVNRAHIAQALMDGGYVASVKEAFKTLLKPEQGYYVPPKRPDALEVISFIKSIGAVAVLAHPLLNLDEVGLRKFLPLAKAAGLDGMETLYAKYTPEETALAKVLAAEFAILESGGSDFHGDTKPDIALGSGRGDLQVPPDFLEQLRNRK
jgi:predicted metal-dependent phosphoesterase TrpH